MHRARQRSKNRIASLLCAASTTAVFLLGCHYSPPLTAQQLEGQHLYNVRCQHCHGENDLALKPAPPDIRGILQRDKLPDGAPATDLAVRRIVLNGKGKMPSFAGRFTEDQMQALLAFLRSRPN